jgi:phosphohistidine swiveling domain-containing protein
MITVPPGSGVGSSKTRKAKAAMAGQMANPIHRGRCDEHVAWSTINAGEAIPGVVTPLTWSFFGDAVDGAMKLTFFDLGVMTREQAVASPNPEDRLWDVFYGRAAGNLNTFRWLGDRMPGTSGDAIEEQIFGQTRPGVQSENILSRYPYVAARMPVSAALLIRRLNATCAPIEAFWQRTVAPGALGSRAQAQAALRTAAVNFSAVMRPHTLAAMLCQALYEQLRAAAERAGRPGLELSLVTGYGEMAETAVVSDLWAVSRERLTLDQFLARHGYHGPEEGELSSHVWRIDRSPLHGLLHAYRQMGEDRDPREIERRRGEERRRSEAELFAALPRLRRAHARFVAALAARFIPLRGTGKAAFLQCVDAARAAALVIGQELTDAGELDAPDDVFMFALEELTGPALGDARAVAAERRATHDQYATLDIPDLFTGVPTPFTIADPRAGGGTGTVVTGTPVSPGIVEGVARLMVEKGSADGIAPGEILVCRTTDPGWASVMMLASALVIDIGGPISHGAIIARELGIPCVIGTRDGTAQLRTGDRLRVDGASGEVTVLASAPETKLEIAEPQVAVTTSAVVESNGESKMDLDELLVLRALRLKGRADGAALAAATGLDTDRASTIATALVAGGEAREMRENFMLLPGGRERLNTLLDEERAGVDAGALTAVYEEFTAVNGDFKQLASDWQLRDGEPNGHDDAVYDQSVIERLPGIDGRVQPIVARAVGLAPRLAPYPGRLTTARENVMAGDSAWLLKPLIDSYHTVWFELHEELIGLAGLSREAEAASGRAE